MITLIVNGKSRQVDVPPDMPLLWAIRENLALTGTKFGCGIAQCGFCQSGQIMAAAALLASKANPTDGDIDAAMAGNICRCGTYQRIRAGIHRAAQIKKGGA